MLCRRRWGGLRSALNFGEIRNYFDCDSIKTKDCESKLLLIDEARSSESKAQLNKSQKSGTLHLSEANLSAVFCFLRERNELNLLSDGNAPDARRKVNFSNYAIFQFVRRKKGGKNLIKHANKFMAPERKKHFIFLSCNSLHMIRTFSLDFSAGAMM